MVLDKLRSEIILNLNAEEGDLNSVNDGMDMILCNFKLKEMKLEFACANNPLWLIRNSELIEYKADKFPMGRYYGDLLPFTNQIVSLEKGDLIYILTDGYPDQFGGPNGKKIKYKALQKILLSVADQSLTFQQKTLENALRDW